MRLGALPLVVLAGFAQGACSPPPEPLDRFGGAIHLPIAPADGAPAAGFFRVASARGRSFLVTPDGHAFVSMGVDNINPDGDSDKKTGQPIYRPAVNARYGTDAAWAAATSVRLAAWTFNTQGAWSRDDLLPGLPSTPILDLAGAEVSGGQPIDFFDPAWQTKAEARALMLAQPRATDPSVIGWFSDNELRWGADWTGPQDLFDLYLSFAASAPGKQALLQLLGDRYGGDVQPFNAAFGTQITSFAALGDPTTNYVRTGEAAAARSAFLALVADRYFSVAAQAILAADPNHLYLGCRFVSWVTPPEPVAAAGKYVDVLSANHYEVTDDAKGVLPSLGAYLSTDGWLAAFAQLSGRPVLISEFAARADDSGLPNTLPLDFVTPDYDHQSQRADVLERYGQALAQTPYLVGLHWFQWVDEPPGGRFDGENSNWGLVSAADQPYGALTARAAEVGPQLTYRTALAR